MDLDLECVASFLILLQEGHYGRAATRLSLSRSALTKRIQRLEHQVGVVLLLRDAVGVVGPTSAGARFAAQALPLLAAARAARTAAHAQGPEQSIHLGVHGRIGDFPERGHLVEVARRLRERHPQVRLMCRSVSLAAPYAGLLEGSVDVLWGAVAPPPPSLDLTPLTLVERLGVVPTCHDLADAGQVCADTLAEMTLLCIRAAPVSLILPFGDVRPMRHARLVRVEAGDSRSLISMLGPGQAAVVGTGSWAASAAQPGLRELHLTDVPPLALYAAHRHTDRREPVHSLIELPAEVAAEPHPRTGA